MRSSPSCLRRGLTNEVSTLAPRKVASGIHRTIVLPDFVMKMRSGAPARRSNKGDDIVSLHALSNSNVESRKMSVTGRQAISMVDDDQVAVSGFAGSVDHNAICRRMYGTSVDASDIQAKMHFGVTVKGICSVSVMARDVAAKRPYARRESKNRGALFRNLLEQAQLTFEIRRPVLQQFHVRL